MKPDLFASFLNALKYRFSLEEDKANERGVIEKPAKNQIQHSNHQSNRTITCTRVLYE
jgi:hypothetical protein